MGLTLNGIAQGYLTDRVVGMLRAAGVQRTLVDMGESRVLGSHPNGRPWQVGIADPDEPKTIGDILAVTDQAVATSGGYGFRFDAARRFNHLLDPATGSSAQAYKSVTAVMPAATAADALSTAFSLMPAERIESALRALGGGRVLLRTASGRHDISI
jgi:thiamine biosynthesis lipoprotein